MKVRFRAEIFSATFLSPDTCVGEPFLFYMIRGSTRININCVLVPFGFLVGLGHVLDSARVRQPRRALLRGGLGRIYIRACKRFNIVWDRLNIRPHAWVSVICGLFRVFLSDFFRWRGPVVLLWER